MSNIDVNALFNISYGMFIITAMDEDKPVGCVVNVCTQITAEPIKLAICVNKDSCTCKAIDKSGKAAINVLSTDVSPKLIGGFGYKSSANTDKFAGISYDIENGTPILKENGIMSYITGKVEQRVDVGTHIMFVIEVEGSETLAQGTPMTYSYFRNEIKGKSPKGAPTYVLK